MVDIASYCEMMVDIGRGGTLGDGFLVTGPPSPAVGGEGTTLCLLLVTDGGRIGTGLGTLGGEEGLFILIAAVGWVGRSTWSSFRVASRFAEASLGTD